MERYRQLPIRFADEWARRGLYDADVSTAAQVQGSAAVLTKCR